MGRVEGVNRHLLWFVKLRRGRAASRAWGLPHLGLEVGISIPGGAPTASCTKKGKDYAEEKEEGPDDRADHSPSDGAAIELTGNERCSHGGIWGGGKPAREGDGQSRKTRCEAVENRNWDEMSLKN